MILGNGDIAKVLNDREGAIFFASGVSNSTNFTFEDIEREVLLLTDRKNTKRCLFYFSTISIYTHINQYTDHKRGMEQIIKQEFENYNIIRIGNIDWGTNPNTFLNALRAKKAKGEQFELFDEYRYMISKEQLLLLTDNLPLTGKNEINAFGYMALVKDLI